MTFRLDFDSRSLMLFGAIYLVMGVAVGIWHPHEHALVHTWLPLGLRLFVWGGFGLIAMITALCSGTVVRGVRLQSIGFAGLFAGPAERSLSYIIGLFITGWGASHVDWRFLTGFSVYALLTLVVAHLAHGDEDARKPPVVVTRTLPGGSRG